MHGFVRVVDSISEFTGKVCAWALFAIGFFITYEIIMRYVFTSPTIWVDEVSRVMQIWSVYLAGAYVIKHHEMVTIDIAFKNRDTLARRLAETLAVVMLLVFAGTATNFGYQRWLAATLAGHTTDSFLAPPKWLTDASVWIGCGLMCLQGLAELWRIWTQGVAETDFGPTEGEI